MIKKFIALYDIHYPINIDLTPIEKFMKEEKPNIIIYGGDAWECEPLSHWGEENRFKEIGLDNIRKELKTQATGLHNMIQKHIQISHANEVYYIEGNHENWIAQYQSKYGNATDPITLDSLTKLSSIGVKIVEQGKPVKIGKMYFVHGDKIAKSSGNVAKTAVSWYQAPIFFGHYHTTQSYGNVSPVDVDSPQVGQCVGCLTTTNPSYNKHKPNACVQQFVFGYINTANGHFTYYTPILVKGSFIWNGKTY